MIVGLGNPGERYQDSRHNIGYGVLDRVTEKLGGARASRVRGSWLASATHAGTKVWFLKPGTFMNRSGDATARILRADCGLDPGLDPESVLVIYDDVDLPLGRLRLRRGGGSGGHRGVQNLVDHLGGAFHRLRVGIGRSDDEALEDFVLEPFTAAEREIMDAARRRAVDACVCWLDEGIEAAMNRYNAGSAAGEGP